MDGNNIAVNNKEKMQRKLIFILFYIFDCFMINLEKKLNVNKIREGFYILVSNKKNCIFNSQHYKTYLFLNNLMSILMSFFRKDIILLI